MKQTNVALSYDQHIIAFQIIVPYNSASPIIWEWEKQDCVTNVTLENFATFKGRY